MLAGLEIIVVAIVAGAIFFFGGKRVISWAKVVGEAKKAYEDASKGKDDSQEKEKE